MAVWGYANKKFRNANFLFMYFNELLSNALIYDIPLYGSISV